MIARGTLYNKKCATLAEAAEHYGVDVRTIKATIAKYPDFPFERIGAQRNKYIFDFDEVDFWLKTPDNDWWRGTREPHVKTERLEKNIAAAATFDPPLNSPQPSGLPETIKIQREELKQRENKSTVQTALLQLELDKKRGLLVDREEVVTFFSMKMATLAKQLELLPNLIGKKMGLNDETIRLFRDHLDEARHAMAADNKGYFANTDQAGA